MFLRAQREKAASLFSATWKAQSPGLSCVSPKAMSTDRVLCPEPALVQPPPPSPLSSVLFTLEQTGGSRERGSCSIAL